MYFMERATQEEEKMYSFRDEKTYLSFIIEKIQRFYLREMSLERMIRTAIIS